MRYKAKSLSHAQYVKSQVRKTPEWKQLRIDLADRYGDTDPITNKKLLKGWNAHHMRMSEETYGDLDLDYFLPLNKQTHETLHWLFRYASKDSDFMNRLCQYVAKMVKFNLGDEEEQEKK